MQPDEARNIGMRLEIQAKKKAELKTFCLTVKDQSLGKIKRLKQDNPDPVGMHL